MVKPQKFSSLLTGTVFSIDEYGMVPFVKVSTEYCVYNDSGTPFNAIWLKSGNSSVIAEESDVYPLAIEVSVIEDFDEEPEVGEPVNRITTKLNFEE
jgi:hypothetical protein